MIPPGNSLPHTPDDDMDRPMSGSILLGEVAARTETIEIACGACERHGTLRTDRLLADHGPAMEVPTLSALFMPIARLI